MIIKEFQGEYRFLSNFYPSPIPSPYSSVPTAPTAEHAFQACKTLDPVEQHHILFAETPGKAKRYGRRATLRPDWDEVKVACMRRILMVKFSHEADTDLNYQLSAVAGATFEEGNAWGDTFWGVDLATGKGKNVLGKLLRDICIQLGDEFCWTKCPTSPEKFHFPELLSEHYRLNWPELYPDPADHLPR